MLINNIPFTCELIDILQELKSQLDINQIPLLNSIKESSGDIMVSCPYHKDGQERKPSAGIRKTDGLFHCFTCGETHSLQEVISHCLGYHDDLVGAEGWKWLLKNFLTISVEERKPIDISTLNRTRYKSYQDTNYVTEEELDKYRYYHSYMWKRKLTPEVVNLFDIGYDKETDCITFPIRDMYGNTLFIARRNVKTKFFNYPKEVEKPLYGIYELTQAYTIYTSIHGEKVASNFKWLNDWNDEIIITESMLDATTCWVYGKPAVALNGTGNELQFRQIKGLPGRKIILATDNDEAGYKARQRIKANIPNKIITEYKFPQGKKDINELTMEEFYNLKEIL